MFQNAQSSQFQLIFALLLAVYGGPNMSPHRICLQEAVKHKKVGLKRKS